MLAIRAPSHIGLGLESRKFFAPSFYAGRFFSDRGNDLVLMNLAQFRIDRQRKYPLLQSVCDGEIVGSVPTIGIGGQKW